MKSLSALPGIGPATSERIVAKLRRRMPKFALLVSRDFFFNDAATTEIYTVSLHDALPISILAVVLAAVFCVLGVLPLIVLTQLGIIVGLGILLDTFLVRTVVIPALFTILGPKVWWPGDIEPDHDPDTDPVERVAV